MERKTNTTVECNGKEFTEEIYQDYKNRSLEELLKIKSSLKRTMNAGNLDRETLEEFEYKIELIESILNERKDRKRFN